MPVVSVPVSAEGRGRAWARAGVLAGACVALDQATKQLAIDEIERGERVDIGLGFALANVRNDGVAFGLLSGGKASAVVLTLAALVALALYFALRPGRDGMWVAVGLVTGGALGNLADRLRSGSVIDYFDPPFWPAFNLADAAIVIGVALVVLAVSAPKRGEIAPGG
jgi:signal peptidase II